MLSRGQTRAEFVYNADHKRMLKVDKNSMIITQTTRYFGDYEKVVTKSNGNIEHRHYITVGGEAVAIRSIKTDKEGLPTESPTSNYLHKDALESVDLITDDTGSKSEAIRLAYEPYGKRRDLSALEGMTSLAAMITHRGFTGHEHIDELDLVHMNGRVYDPESGRFLSADPFVQAPWKTQNFNRYSYVMGNPMRYTDPSGFEWDDPGSIGSSSTVGYSGGYSSQAEQNSTESGGNSFSGGDGDNDSSSYNDFDPDQNGEKEALQLVNEAERRGIYDGSSWNYTPENRSLIRDYLYGQIVDKKLNFKKNNPEKAIPISRFEFGFILSYEMTRIKSLSNEWKDFVYNMAGKKHAPADTLFRQFENSSVNIDGLGTFPAGHVNYVGVGMMSSHYYGGALGVAPMAGLTIGWNSYQAARRQSMQDIRDIPESMGWGAFGSFYFSVAGE